MSLFINFVFGLSIILQILTVVGVKTKKLDFKPDKVDAEPGKVASEAGRKIVTKLEKVAAEKGNVVSSPNTEEIWRRAKKKSSPSQMKLPPSQKKKFQQLGARLGKYTTLWHRDIVVHCYQKSIDHSSLSFILISKINNNKVLSLQCPLTRT